MIHSIEQIRNMRKRLSSDGKWTCREHTNGFARWGEPDPPPVFVVEGPDYTVDSLVDDAIDHEPDAEFIAAAPEIVDFLLAHIEAYDDLHAALREIRDHKGYAITFESTEHDINYVDGANDALKQCKTIARRALGD